MSSAQDDLSHIGGIGEILSTIQKKLKVSKIHKNTFSNFNYRSCEDILEALKEHLPEGVYLLLNDEIVSVGDRFYIKSTASLHYENQVVSVQAFAREPVEKKKFDDSQVTGAASSYARKYALSGLFMIDDSKDIDSEDNGNKPEDNPTSNSTQSDHKNLIHIPMTNETIIHLKFLFDYMKVSTEKKHKFSNWARVNKLSELSEQQAIAIIKNLEKESPQAAQAWIDNKNGNSINTISQTVTEVNASEPSLDLTESSLDVIDKIIDGKERIMKEDELYGLISLNNVNTETLNLLKKSFGVNEFRELPDDKLEQLIRIMKDF